MHLIHPVSLTLTFYLILTLNHISGITSYRTNYKKNVFTKSYTPIYTYDYDDITTLPPMRNSPENSIKYMYGHKVDPYHKKPISRYSPPIRYQNNWINTENSDKESQYQPSTWSNYGKYKNKNIKNIKTVSYPTRTDATVLIELDEPSPTPPTLFQEHFSHKYTGIKHKPYNTDTTSTEVPSTTTEIEETTTEIEETTTYIGDYYEEINTSDSIPSETETNTIPIDPLKISTNNITTQGSPDNEMTQSSEMLNDTYTTTITIATEDIYTNPTSSAESTTIPITSSPTTTSIPTTTDSETTTLTTTTTSTTITSTPTTIVTPTTTAQPTTQTTEGTTTIATTTTNESVVDILGTETTTIATTTTNESVVDILGNENLGLRQLPLSTTPSTTQGLILPTIPSNLNNPQLLNLFQFILNIIPQIREKLNSPKTIGKFGPGCNVTIPTNTTIYGLGFCVTPIDVTTSLCVPLNLKVEQGSCPLSSVCCYQEVLKPIPPVLYPYPPPYLPTPYYSPPQPPFTSAYQLTPYSTYNYQSAPIRLSNDLSPDIKILYSSPPQAGPGNAISIIQPPTNYGASPQLSK